MTDESIDLLNLKISQLNQISEQYRQNIYNLELKTQLLLKFMEEKGVLLKEEFERRWVTFLKNDIGVQDQNGMMEGSLKVTFYRR